ncbi:MAG: c-type cytochrome [Bacteroidota bacterium]
MRPGNPKENSDKVTKTAGYIVRIGAVACVITIFFYLIFNNDANKGVVVATDKNLSTERLVPFDAWHAPDSAAMPPGKQGEMVKYGRELITHTAVYFGPSGNLAQLSNGMNCQNCHLGGGTRLYGNNFASFIATYPKMSARSGQMEPATQRIVECFSRSLGGKSPDTTAKEVQAMLAYMKWIGKDVKKNARLFGNATEKLPYLNGPADAGKGKLVYAAKCQSCHGAGGQGLLTADKKSYTYPPLWGSHSYNDGAGMYRLGNLAGFVKNNMPYGATYENPQLTDEECWNVAAFINTQPRTHRDQRNDYTNLAKKPIDAPFGPYADIFSERQHKLGPFKPILAYQKAHPEKK